MLSIIAFALTLWAGNQPPLPVVSEVGSTPGAGEESAKPAPDELRSFDDSSREYARLRALPAAERQAALRNLSRASKAALWSYRLRRVVAEHPEFTDEQRAVLNDAISWVRSDVYGIDSSDPRFETQVHEPLLRLEARAKAAFGAAKARELLTQLFPESGSSVPETDGAAGGAAARSSSRFGAPTPLLKDGPSSYDCTCSVFSDWCPYFYDCRLAPCIVIENNCGTLGSYDCRGLCFPTSPT